MAGYDATDALDDLFANDDDEEPESSDSGLEGDARKSGGLEAVAARTQAILDARPTEPVDLVMNLARGLPQLNDIREVHEDDTSELSETEQRQRGQTENVIRSAVAAGEASIWVIALGLQGAAKGRWWRSSHNTYEHYVNDLTGRSASYIRRLRSGAPLALTTAARTGTVPNPGQNRESYKAQQQHGQDAAVMLFQVVTEVTEELGDKVTAQTLAAARDALPAELPELPAQKRAAIERSTRLALGQGVPIGTPVFEENSNKGVPIGTPTPESSPQQAPEAAPESGTGAEESGQTTASAKEEEEEEILDAEIVPDSVVALQDAITALNSLNRLVSKDTWDQAAKEADPHLYADLRARVLSKTTSFQKKALHAPLVYEPPACQTCETTAVPNPPEVKVGKPGAYWWCVTCKATRGERKPL
ncbi:hypothetical protein ACFC7A_31725 [Streptomyces niveus]|uniref:hypothetical protein n=1 Tax=Streptomyces niveus TaxID=193462 RepID=UPI0035E34742